MPGYGDWARIQVRGLGKRFVHTSAQQESYSGTVLGTKCEPNLTNENRIKSTSSAMISVGHYLFSVKVRIS